MIVMLCGVNLFLLIYEIINMGVTFIVFHKNGTREQYSTNYSEDNEQEVDAAWDEVRMMFPDADYIERF